MFALFFHPVQCADNARGEVCGQVAIPAGSIPSGYLQDGLEVN